MIEKGPTTRIVVVSRRECRVYATLGREFAHVADVRWSQALPQLAPDVVVIDVDEAPCPLQMFDVAAIAHQCDVYLTIGAQLVAPTWLDLVATSPVTVFDCALSSGVAGLNRLVSTLTAKIHGPSPDRMVALVLSREPLLARVEPLIRAVLSDPWGIRRPSDLARAARCRVGVVKGKVRALQFIRVEHLITIVRALAYEGLIGEGTRSPLARRLVGIKDPSNFRHQLTHARTRSPVAWRKLRSLCAGLAVMVLPFLAACGSGGSGGSEAGAAAAEARTDTAIALPVTGALVRRGDLVLTVRTTGQVRAERLVVLKAETQGTIDSVAVRPGQRVPSGAVLVRLDLRPFDLAVREAEGAVQDALARWRDVLVGDDTADARPEAMARRQAARLRSGLDAAEARLERAKLDRDRATVRAPFGGTVDQVDVVVGQRVTAGETLTTLVDLGSLLVEAAVLEHDLPLIRRGASARVGLSAAPDRAFLGSVTAVLPLVDTASRAGRVLVRVRTQDGVLRPGMYADVELEATRLPDRVMVAAPAVIERDGRPLVFRFSNGHAEWVYIAAGRSNGRETEVLPDSVTGRPAVQAGDTVLVEGHLTLTHDAPVRLLLRAGSDR